MQKKHISLANQKKIVGYLKKENPDMDGNFFTGVIEFVNLYYEEKKRNKDIAKIDPLQSSIFDPTQDELPL